MRAKNLLCCLAAIVLSMNVQAQDLKIHTNKKGKIGFVDQNGNEVVKCQYESAQPFTDGTSIVSKSGKYGLIDTSGKVVLPLKYSQIISWNEDLYQIKDGKKIGLADHQGKVVLPAKYSLISKSNCYGKALLALGGKATSNANEKKTYMAKAKYGIIDSRGNILVNPKYKGLYEFSYDGTNTYPFYEGKRLEFSYHHTVDTLKTDCSYLGFSGNAFNIYNAGVMDGNGKELVKAGLYYFVMQPQSNMVRYYNSKKKQTICGFHDINKGKGFQVSKIDLNINNINYWTHGDFIGDIAPVNGTSWTFIDKNNNTLRSGYSSLKHSQITGLWAAKNSSGKWEVFNDANNNVDALSSFEDIYFPTIEGDKEIFTVLKDGKYGCVKRNGDIVIPFDYEMALSNTYDVVAVKKDGKWGMLTADNVPLIPIEFEGLRLPTERNAKHFWVTKSDSLSYHFIPSTNKLSNKGYKCALNFIDDYAYVTPVDMIVDNTPLNRAQMYAPNASKASIDAVDLSKHYDSFVNIINSKDELVFDLPVSTMYMDVIRKEIKKWGGKQLSESEKKNLLLEVTKSNRSYDLKSTLSEEEWNY